MDSPVPHSKFGHIFPCLSHIALDTWTPMSHLTADYSLKERSSFLWWDFFSPKKLFSWLSRAAWHTAQAHQCSSLTGGGMGTLPKASRICHSAASSLSDHIKLIMKLHFEQLQNLLAGQTRGALPRKGENTQKEQIALGVLWKSSSEHHEEMFWERELWLVQQCRSCYWQGGFGLFSFFFLPRKNTCIWVLPCPHCSIYPGYKRELKGTAPSEDQWKHIPLNFYLFYWFKTAISKVTIYNSLD